MRKLTRRRFLNGALLPAVVGTLPARAVQGGEPQRGAVLPPDIVDTNVHLFDWPFRRLKYAGARALVAKLRRHRITQAWAGSYEGLLHRDLDGVNARLAEECRANGAGILLPFGTVNPALPDWEADVRRCHEVECELLRFTGDPKQGGHDDIVDTASMAGEEITRGTGQIFYNFTGRFGIARPGAPPLPGLCYNRFDPFN